MLDRIDLEPVFFAPFVSSVMRVEPQWIDYNGHLNVAYYNVLFDRAVDEIVRTAEETACDLIVLGTHGLTGLRRALMGSVAEQVVRKAPCPVLTVKTPSPVAHPASGAGTGEGAAAPSRREGLSS